MVNNVTLELEFTITNPKIQYKIGCSIQKVKRKNWVWYRKNETPCINATVFNFNYFKNKSKNVCTYSAKEQQITKKLKKNATLENIRFLKVPSFV